MHMCVHCARVQALCPVCKCQTVAAHVYTHVYTHAYTRAYTRVHTHVYTHADIHAHVHVYAYVHTCENAYLYVHEIMCMSTHMARHMSTDMHMRGYTTCPSIPAVKNDTPRCTCMQNTHAHVSTLVRTRVHSHVYTHDLTRMPAHMSLQQPAATSSIQEQSVCLPPSV